MKTSDFLVAAKGLIDAPTKLCKGVMALDKDGEEVLTSDPNACRFCSTGALRCIRSRVFEEPTFQKALFGLTEAFQNRDHLTIISQDFLEYSEIMQCWDDAISQARKDEEQCL